MMNIQINSPIHITNNAKLIVPHQPGASTDIVNMQYLTEVVDDHDVIYQQENNADAILGVSINNAIVDLYGYIPTIRDKYQFIWTLESGWLVDRIYQWVQSNFETVLYQQSGLMLVRTRNSCSYMNYLINLGTLVGQVEPTLLLRIPDIVQSTESATFKLSILNFPYSRV